MFLFSLSWNPCSWKHLQRESPYSDIYVLSKVLIYHFLLLIALKWHNCFTLQITQFIWDSFFSSAKYAFCNFFICVQEYNLKVSFNSFLCKRSHFFCCSVLYLYYFPPAERLTACSNHYNSFSTTRSSPYNSILNYTMCKIHTQQNVWIFSALLQTNLTSLVLLSRYQMYYAQKCLEIITILGLWTRQQFSLLLVLLFSNVNA